MARPLSRTAMLRWFERGFKPRSEHRVGVEWEKELLHADGRRARFDEPGGVQDALKGLTQFGWTAEFEGPHVVKMERGEASVTIEPGGQLEFASPPRSTVAELERDVRQHLGELQRVTAGTGIRPVSVGYTPVEPVADIPLVPKARYAIMERLFKKTGTMGQGMMKGTSSVQVALDVCNREDASRKVDVALGISPLVTALFANSPLADGRDTGWASWRARCWQHTDPSRTGLLAEATGNGFSYERYLDWLLDVPMLFVRSGDGLESAHGRTFRDFAATGVNGRDATTDDLALHINTLFPEVRVTADYIEMRSADNVPLPMIPALAALWKGLLYDPTALETAAAVAAAIPARERGRVQHIAASDGLAGRFKRRRLRSWMAWVLEIAAEGLGRQSPDGPAEVAYLAPLQELVEIGESPAIALWRAFEQEPDALVETISYPPVNQIPVVDPRAAS